MSQALPPIVKLYRRLSRSRRVQQQTTFVACLLVLIAFILAPMALTITRPSAAGPTGTVRYDGTSTIAWLTPAVQAWREPVDRYAQAYDISADLVMLIITLESNGNPDATSRVGAQGLMQVMPGTAADINRRWLLQPRPDQPYDLYDPATNIEFGTAYLAYLRDRYTPRGETASYVGLLAAGYNGGPGAADAMLNGTARSKENTDYATAAALLWDNRQAGTMPVIRR